MVTMKLSSCNGNGRSDSPSFLHSKVHVQTVKHTYLAWGFIAFNMLYGLVMFLCSTHFARFVTQFSTFSLVYALALVAAAFALRDRRVTLLYPIVIVTALVVFASAIVSVFFAFNYFYCSLKLSSSASSAPTSSSAAAAADNASSAAADERVVGILNSADSDKYEDYADASSPPSAHNVEVIRLYRNIWKCRQAVNTTSEQIVLSVALLFIIVTKSAEFFVYRRLMRLLHLVHHHNDGGPQPPPPFHRHVIQPADMIGDLRKKPSGFRSLERVRNGSNAGATVDSDDDMVVYERTPSRQSSQSSGTRLRPGGGHVSSAKINTSVGQTPFGGNNRVSLPTVAGSKKIIA